MFRPKADSVTRSDVAPASPVEPPYREDCCTCGSTYFVPGGPVVTCRSNGTTAKADTNGAVLTCLGCGERWYQTPNGLRSPHEAAMPAPWAMRDLQARANSKPTRERDPERPVRRMAGPHEGFALPPKV
jgi:hypothetical protein